MTVKLIAFAGSSRKASLNKKLARAAAHEAETQGAHVTLVDLVDFPMPIYNGDLEEAEGAPAAAKRLKALIREHDAVFIAAPEYNSGVTPLLKNTIDWLTRKHDDESDPIDLFKRCVWGLGAVSNGSLGGLRGLIPLRQTFIGLSALVVSEQTAVKFGNDAFDENDRLKDEATARLLKNQIARMIKVATALGAYSAQAGST